MEQQDHSTPKGIYSSNPSHFVKFGVKSTKCSCIAFLIFVIGPSHIPLWKGGLKDGTNAWGIPLGKNSYHASSDASLFSTSLPVLPHEKCMSMSMLLLWIYFL